ncbi:zf-HC2 domain-containing protein [Streptomyces sp. SCA3-4]|uniref:zf-HC2 domain-containing protein n=1 Tax=Streptomyces sichuanensis TaxID=2871810 RepID=UPI001CE2FDBA|nr:zf-HC2 domain-containing protein [Streptomyces sichuanensis]MCA6093172.1 zf-HC2 domain-containing protein [Streptomyces sichuanensis]
MHCSEVRTAISARVDGEELPPGVSDAVLDAHLQVCAECRAWGERARRLKALAAGLGLGTGSGPV